MHKNPETGLSFPSLSTLARESGLARSRVAQIVTNLEALGELTHENWLNLKGGVGANRYAILLSAGSPPPSGQDTPHLPDNISPSQRAGEGVSCGLDAKGNLKENSKHNYNHNGALRPVPSARSCGGESFFETDDVSFSPSSRECSVPRSSFSQNSKALRVAPPDSVRPPQNDQAEAKKSYLNEMLVRMIAEMRGFWGETSPVSLSKKMKDKFLEEAQEVDYECLRNLIARAPYAWCHSEDVKEYEHRRTAGEPYRALDGFDCKHSWPPHRLVQFRDTILPYTEYVAEKNDRDAEHPEAFFNRRWRELCPAVAQQVGYYLPASSNPTTTVQPPDDLSPSPDELKVLEAACEEELNYLKIFPDEASWR
jgi:hypothetical protein